MSKSNGHKVIGTKQTLRALKNGEVKAVYIARDAEERIINDVQKTAKESNVQVVYVPTMVDLGKAFGIEVGAATAALLKVTDED
jgi:large subunit ribosomal protein L7A